MKYLLDTDICIHLIRKKQKELIQKIRKVRTEEIGISTITVSELEYGVEKSTHPEHNRMALMEFLLPFTILEFDQAAAHEYGKIRTELERKGMIIGSMDLLIAAHAKATNLVLITNNEKEFGRIELLSIENWVREKAV